MDQQAEEDKTERLTGLGRRTREQIAKWNQMTALRFQTVGETSDIPGLPSGGIKKDKHQTHRGGYGKEHVHNMHPTVYLEKRVNKDKHQTRHYGGHEHARNMHPTVHL